MLYNTLESAIRAANELNQKTGFPPARVYHCGLNGLMGGKGAFTVVRAYVHPWCCNAELAAQEVQLQ